MKETKLKIKGKKAPKIKPKSFANNWAIYLYRFIKGRCIEHQCHHIREFSHLYNQFVFHR